MKYLAIFFCVLTINSFSQQQIIFEETRQESFLVKYSPGSGDAIKNYILQIIAENIPKPLNITQFTFSYNQRCRIVKKFNELEFIVEFKDIILKNDIAYKGFPVVEGLFPHSVDFSVKWMNTNNDLIEVINFTNIGLNEQGGGTFRALSHIVTDTTGNTNYRFEVVNKNFRYDQINKKLFTHKINVIDAYYDADSRILLAFGDLESINTQNLDMIYEYRNLIVNTENLVNQIRTSDYYHILPLSQFDPVDLDKKMYDLEQMIQKVKREVEATIQRLYELYYNKALKFIAQGEIVTGEQYLLKSLSSNPDFAPAHYQLALINYNDGNFRESVEKLVEVFTSTPDPTTKALAVNLINKIYNDLLEQIKHMNQSEQFHNALETITIAEEVCDMVSAVPCPEEITRQAFLARTGIYQNLLDKVDKALKSDNIFLAEEYFSKAEAFQKEHNLELSPNAGAIFKKIKQQKYNLLINQGTAYSGQKNYKDALEKYEYAKEIERNFTVEKNRYLDSYLKKTAKKLALQILEKGSRLAAGNQLPEARKSYNKAAEISHKYKLENDREIKNSFASLKDKIFTQECNNAQLEYDLKFNAGLDFIKKKDFINADAQFDKAMKIASDNIECGISISNAEKKKQEIEAGVSYQQKLRQVNDLIDRRSYEEAIRVYLKTGEYFNENSVGALKIEHKPLFVFIKEKNTGFINYGSRYFAKNKELKKSLSLLDELRKLDVHRKATKNNQTLLGTQLAIQDYNERPETIAKQYVITYTNGDSWFKYLRRAYKKQRRRLEKGG